MTTEPGGAPTLRQLQRRMTALLLRPERLDGSAAALIVPPPAGTPAARLHVYADGYPARIQEALAETFPSVAHVIGEPALARLTERYIRATVLRSYNLNDAGSGLPPFLRNDPLTERLPFLPDLAELEWHIARAFHAHEHPPLDPTPLSTWTMAEWERAVLRFQPSVALVSSAWPIRSIWECRETPVEQIDLEMLDRPERVLIYRNGLQMCCESVDAHEATVLAALLAGRSLGDTARSIEGARDGGSLPAAAFARWMRAGIIVRCSLARPARAGGRRARSRRRHVPSRAGR